MARLAVGGALQLAAAELYCPTANDLVVAYGDGVQLKDGGWSVHGDGGAATKTAFNLNGGYVEYDMDVSAARPGVIPNLYSISPGGIGGGGFVKDQHYCDGAAGSHDYPWCMEIDWIESNGGCGGATTIHTVPGEGDNGCTGWGCRTSYHFGNSRYHMKVSYDNSGHLSVDSDQFGLGGFSPDPSGAWETIRSTHESNGAVLYSSQWTSGWVPPPDDCGSGPGDLDGSSFSISNLRISGTVVQGPEPTKCSGPSPPGPPTPPTPPPSPGQCTTFPGKNNDGTNLKSTADIASSSADCCSKCASTDGCVGWSFIASAGNECWLKSSVDSPRDDGCGGCVVSGTVNAPPAPPPAPPAPPAPTPPSPSGGCPGGSLEACIKACPSDMPVFQICTEECTERCGGGDSCTGGDDGSDLATCMHNCPSDTGFADCVTCCSTKFPGGKPSCTGGDDGSDLATCMKNCPIAKFADCVGCCSDEFPSDFQSVV
jgi:hypothetical protein